MNRHSILRGLLLCALLAWGYAAWQLWDAWHVRSARESNTSKSMIGELDDSCHRDPFQRMHARSVATAGRLRHTASDAVSPKVTVPKDSLPSRPAPPLPRWNAFVEGTPPLVVLAKASKTELVKAGDSAFGWYVVSLSPSGVRLRAGSHQAYVTP